MAVSRLFLSTCNRSQIQPKRLRALKGIGRWWRRSRLIYVDWAGLLISWAIAYGATLVNLACRCLVIRSWCNAWSGWRFSFMGSSFKPVSQGVCVLSLALICYFTAQRFNLSAFGFLVEAFTLRTSRGLAGFAQFGQNDGALNQVF